MSAKQLLVLAVIGALVTGCSQFPTTYSRVDEGKVRLLDFTYDPPEAAPGDTVLLRAVFAGDSIDEHDITWSASYRLAYNKYGSIVALDTVALTPVFIDTAFTDSTSCVAFRFVVPTTILHTSPLIPEDWMSVVRLTYKGPLPSQIESMSKDQLITNVDGLSVLAMNGLLDLNDVDPQLVQSLPLIMQFLTVRMCIRADVSGSHPIKSLYSVRYNSRFGRVPGAGVFVNTNPVIDSIGIYQVHKKNLAVFNPGDGTYTYEFFRLFGPSDTDALGRSNDSIVTVTIDAGCTYFIKAFTDNLDRAVTMDVAVAGTPPGFEKHKTQWYFQLNPAEIADVSPFDFMNIGNSDNMLEAFFPSKDDRVRSATIWCEVFDEMLNEKDRPQGSTLKELRVRFEYTDAYREQVDKEISWQ